MEKKEREREVGGLNVGLGTPKWPYTQIIKEGRKFLTYRRYDQREISG